MSIVDDVLKVLDHIPIWKRLVDVPGEVDDLKRRVAELEDKLGDKYPGDVCKFCGARAARLSASVGQTEKGKIKQHWQCAECKKYEIRLV